MTLAALFLPVVIARAVAETASVLPAHAVVLYSGPGVTTFNQLNTGLTGGFVEEREVPRAFQIRLDVYAVWSPLERLQLSLYVPPTYAFAIDHSEPRLSVAQAGVQARWALSREVLQSAVGLGVASQAWNWQHRNLYTMAGEATTDILPAIYLGTSGAVAGFSLGAALFGNYAFRIPAGEQPDVEGKAPKDHVRAGLEARAGRGPVTLEVGGYTYQRLGGTIHYTLKGSPDVYAAADYDNVSLGLKLSVSLPKNNGLHTGFTRAVWVHNGPIHATDVTLGFHHYFAP